MYNKLNGVQLGQALGKDRKTVSRWTKDGMPRNKDGTYNLPHVIKWMLEREKEGAIGDQAMKAGDSPALERYRMARAEAAELDLQVKRGELISHDMVCEQWAQRVTEICSGLEHLSDRLSAILPGKVPEDIRTTVCGEVWALRDQYCRVGKYCEIAE